MKQGAAGGLDRGLSKSHVWEVLQTLALIVVVIPYFVPSITFTPFLVIASFPGLVLSGLPFVVGRTRGAACGLVCTGVFAIYFVVGLLFLREIESRNFPLAFVVEGPRALLLFYGVAIALQIAALCAYYKPFSAPILANRRSSR